MSIMSLHNIISYVKGFWAAAELCSLHVLHLQALNSNMSTTACHAHLIFCLKTRRGNMTGE